MATLSVVLATYNEEKNLPHCLQSVKDIADETVIVDGTSSDKTVEIAKSFGAKVTVTGNPPIFHINKQKAIDQATKDWVLQLDADEWVSKDLAKEITHIISLSEKEIETYENTLSKKELFARHQALLVGRDGVIGTDSSPYVAFFLPRRNYFLGRYLMHGGVYPDGVIRLFKRGKAYLPAKDVHEQMVVDGRVGWLSHDLLHMDSPTFQKYITRWRRYTTLIGKDLKRDKIRYTIPTGINYLVWKPLSWFFLQYGRHKGFLDGWQGFVFAFFSALRFPAAYIKSRT